MIMFTLSVLLKINKSTTPPHDLRFIQPMNRSQYSVKIHETLIHLLESISLYLPQNSDGSAIPSPLSLYELAHLLTTQ